MGFFSMHFFFFFSISTCTYIFTDDFLLPKVHVPFSIFIKEKDIVSKIDLRYYTALQMKK